MTEAEWGICNNYKQMLTQVVGKVSERKLRLHNCGIDRYVWKSLTLKPVRQAVLTSERFADGQANELELDTAYRAAVGRWYLMTNRTDHRMREPDHLYKMFRMAHAVDSSGPGVFQFLAEKGQSDDDPLLKSIRPVMLRCVAGNPFRPVTFDPRWRTSDVVGVAQAIYEDRAFDRLPILAGALMDAGCDHDDILAHCRSDGPHVRGCWVVDLVLGKE